MKAFMKSYILVLTLALLASCIMKKDTPSSSEIETPPSKKELTNSKEEETDPIEDTLEIAEFYEITKISSSYYDESTKSWKMDCGDEAYWGIIKLGKDAVPFLIDRIKSTEPTKVKNPCSDQMLTEGGLAFILLEDMLNIPFYTAFGIQYDVFEMDCKFPLGLLEDVMHSSDFFFEKLNSWYSKEKKKYRLVELDNDTKTECQEKFGVTHVLTAE